MAAILAHPQQGRDLLEIGGTQVEVATVIAMGGLKPDRRRLPRQGLGIIAPVFQVPIDGAAVQEGLERADEPVGSLDTIIFASPIVSAVERYRPRLLAVRSFMAAISSF